MAGWKILLASTSAAAFRLHVRRASDKLHRNLATAILYGQPDFLLLILEILQHLFLGSAGNPGAALSGVHQLHGGLLFGAEYLLDSGESGVSGGADPAVVRVG